MELRNRSACRAIDLSPVTTENSVAVIKRPRIVIPQQDVPAVVIVSRVYRIVRNRNPVAQLRRVGLRRSVPCLPIRTGELGRFVQIVRIYQDGTDHVHRAVGELSDVDVVHVHEHPVINHQRATTEAQKIGSG